MRLGQGNLAPLVFKLNRVKVILWHLLTTTPLTYLGRLTQIKLGFSSVSSSSEPTWWKKQLGEISFKQFGLNQQGRKSSEVFEAKSPFFVFAETRHCNNSPSRN